MANSGRTRIHVSIWIVVLLFCTGLSADWAAGQVVLTPEGGYVVRTNPNGSMEAVPLNQLPVGVPTPTPAPNEAAGMAAQAYPYAVPTTVCQCQCPAGGSSAAQAGSAENPQQAPLYPGEQNVPSDQYANGQDGASQPAQGGG